MEKPPNINSKILALTVIVSLLSVLGLIIFFLLFSIPLQATVFILSGFVFFVLSVLALYYFYHIFLTRHFLKLNEAIRLRLFPHEIPKISDQLEDEDGFKTLNERVHQMIEMREKERQNHDHIDSYRKQYLGNVSHELKTPVFNVQGYIDTLLHGGLSDPEVNVNFLKRAEASIERLIHIIDDLETITQLESGTLILDKEQFDIAQLVKDIFNSLEFEASKKTYRLTLAKKYDKPILVFADPFRIRQVLVNLISNSIKYGKVEGQTTILISTLKDDVVVEVSDNGLGIDPEHLPRIFERFYRVDKGRSRAQGGTGLGLSIVKHILEAHQKSIEVQSVLGVGTTFRFSISSVEV
ncbi:MAG: sensor histidine kinase [Bacteroidia bacterium]|jgi:two-component system, OmpR family, phosphate regulon sensor histidine kinase PhoR|nr:sensor histidine kinase [Bacteroidia bacterium]NBX19266.1 sensor histidine kinase [Bacteroidia bacterium]